MQEVSKVSVDLFFCFIISFLVVQATNSSHQNQNLTNILNAESARISANHGL